LFPTPEEREISDSLIQQLNLTEYSIRRLEKRWRKKPVGRKLESGVNHYKEARRIYYSMNVGDVWHYNNDNFSKIQQSLNVVKRRHRDKDKEFRTSKKDFSVCRTS
jgi:hypothetical protein